MGQPPQHRPLPQKFKPLCLELDLRPPRANVIRMFPLRDHNPSRRPALVTYGLIAVNLAVFLAMLPSFGDDRALASVFANWAFIPARISAGQGYDTVFSAMFMHGGLMHIAGNMLFLWIFGDNMEDEMGPFRFLMFYLACGMAAAFAQYISDPGSRVPMVGASGAIAGVLGGYMLLFPRARVDVLFIFIIFFKVIPLPAWIILGLWFLLQLLGELGSTGGAGVAYLAHVGGFLAGLVLTYPLWRRRGGSRFWARTAGRPPHRQTNYRVIHTPVPVVRRKRK